MKNNTKKTNSIKVHALNVERISQMIEDLNEKEKEYLFNLLCTDNHSFGHFFEE